jgi:Short C-terminal domain
MVFGANRRVARRTARRVTRRQAGLQDAMEPEPEPYPAAPPPAAAPPAGQDLTEQLAALAKLKEQGVLSDAEFAAAKQKLLGT